MTSGGPRDTTYPSGAGGAAAEVHGEEAYCSACNQSFALGAVFCPNDGARLIRLAAQRDLLIGRVLDQRYEIRAPLGKGGMGTVYRGWQLSVDREVAIKVIHPKLSDDRSTVKRFLREARLASRLSQANIVNVYDFGQSETVLYLVMELLRGRTLASELGRGRPIDLRRAIVITAQLCDALEAAHAQGIVHRDLKPSNIVILDGAPGRDLIKVLDFGLAKSLIHDSGSVVTNTDALLGTPLYMAPEQIEGRASDQRADLYSLGCIVYEMLTGRPPFLDNAISAVLARHIQDKHEPLPPHVPAGLCELIDKLLAKAPADRLQTAGEVRTILEAARDSAPVVAARPAVGGDIPGAAGTSQGLAKTHAAPSPPAAVLAATHSSMPSGPAAPKRGRYVIVALLAVVAFGIGAFVLLNAKQSSPGGEPASGAGSSVMGVRGSGSSGQVVEALPPSADAAVYDAQPAAVVEPALVPVDAGVSVKKPDGKRPRVRPDAGTQPGLPDIDFIEVNKKK